MMYLVAHPRPSCSQTLKQFIIAMSGSFDVDLDVDLDDDEDGERIHPNRSYQGLPIPTMVWREVECFFVRFHFCDAGVREFLRG